MATNQLKSDSKYDDYDFPSISPEKKPGHPGHTTPEQDAQVFQLRTQLEQAGCTERLDTLSMLRFLRARKFNVEHAKQMFLNCEKWRKKFGTDDLVRDFDFKEKPQVFEYYPQYYHKTDKDGRPVYIEQYGKIDLKALYKITTSDRMLQNLVTEYEKLVDPRLPACCRKEGLLLETCCTIMDLKGVGVSSIPSVYGYVKSATGIAQDYYPERLGKLYIINAPWGFASAFSVVKGFLDPVTVQKIHVLGGGYQKELLNQIPKENLPELFGGTCRCEKSCQLSDTGPWQDPQWTKPPKWEREKPSTAIEDQPSMAVENQPSSGVEQHKPAPAAGQETAGTGAGAEAAAGQAPIGS